MYPSYHSLIQKYLLIYNVAYPGGGPSCGISKRVEMITTLVTIFIYWEKLQLKMSNHIKYLGVMKERILEVHIKTYLLGFRQGKHQII